MHVQAKYLKHETRAVRYYVTVSGARTIDYNYVQTGKAFFPVRYIRARVVRFKVIVY